MQQDRAILHAGQAGDAGMHTVIVEQFTVNFVRDDDEVMLDRKCGDLLQLLDRLNAACGVRGEVQHDDLRLRRDRLLDIGSEHGKVMRRAGIDRHGHAERHLDARVVAHVAGLVVDDFITRIDQCTQGEI